MPATRLPLRSLVFLLMPSAACLAAPVVSAVNQFPVIPGKADAVSIAVQVSGATAATLRWKTDGAAGFTSVPLALTSGSTWTGSIPAQSAGTTIEYFIDATDGTAITWPGATQPALYRVEDVSPANAWTAGAAPVWRFIVKSSDSAALTAGTGVNATAVIRDGAGTVVRHGCVLRQREASPKAYALTFPAGSAWEGRQSVLLSADRPHCQVFGAAVFHRAGLPCPAVEPVEVRLNGLNMAAAGSPSYGRFALSEPLDAAWAQRQFPGSAAGNLYQLDDSGPGTHGALAYETPATNANYAETYRKQTNQGAGDWSDVIALTDKLSNAPAGSFRSEISAHLDLTQWLQFLALDALLGNTEPGLQTGRGTDVALYAHPAAKFQFVPTELRAIAGQGASAGTETRSLFTADATAGLTRLLQHPDILPDYTRSAQALLDATFTMPVLESLLEATVSGWVPSAEVTAMQDYLAARRNAALSQLPSPYGAMSITGEAASVEGMATTATGTLTLSGTFPVSQVGSILVNGVPATANFRTLGPNTAGTWSFTATGANLPRGINRFLVEFFSGTNGTGTLLLSLTGTGFYSGGGTTVTSVTAPPNVTDTLVASGGNPPASAPANAGPWRYLESAAPAGWQNEGFNDTIWAEGTPHFGFGETDQRTSMTNVAGRATYYFRRTFNVDPAAAGTYSSLSMRLLYDDGAIVYLNGTEIARRNLPASGVTDTTPASSSRGTSNENSFETIALTAFLSSLKAGTNTLAVEIHNNLASGSDDLSLDLEITGVRPSSPDTRWTRAGSPYLITSNLSVPSGVTLAIDPGVSVFFSPGRKISMSSGATLKVLGTPYGRVQFSHVPGATPIDDTDLPGSQIGPPKWKGISVDGSRNLNNRISYADFNNGQVSGFDATLNLNRSTFTIEYCTFRGTKFHAIRGDSSSLTVTDCYFYTDYKPGENPLTLGLDNASEFIQLGVGGASGAGFTGNWPTGGVLKFYRNTFEAMPGHNDAMDIQSGKWGVTPVLDVQDNIFLGPTGDEGIDLEGDVYIAGNFFSNIKKDAYTEDLGYANALSIGESSAVDTTAVIARNVFTRIDNVTAIRGNTGAIVEHNTIACHNNDYVFTGGGSPQTVRPSVVGFYIPEDPKTPGDGAYVAFNIMYGSAAHFGGGGNTGFPRVFGNADSGSTTAKIEMFANFIDPAIQDPVIGVRHPNNVLHPSWQTVTGNPLFTNVAADDYSLQSGSPARNSAPGGFDYGASIAKGCYLLNVPPVITAQTTAAITVGGPGIFAYKWRLNGGAWSSTVSIAPGVFPRTTPTVRTAVLNLSGLTAGLQTLEVIGQDFAGNWTPDAEATRATWTVEPSIPLLFLNEVQAGAAGGIELYNAGTVSIPLAGWSLTDTTAAPGKFALSGSLAAGAWLTLTPAQTGITLPFAGGAVYLYQGAAQRDAIITGAQSSAFSTGRTGRDRLWALCTPTPSATNTPAATGEVSSLRFSEWLPGTGGWVELTNTSAAPVSLTGLVLTANRPGSSSAFTFPSHSVLAPGGYLLLTASDSSTPGHLPFQIRLEDSALTLLEGNDVIDSVRISRPAPGNSEGRSGDQITYLPATPGNANASAATSLAAWLVQYNVSAASDGDADGLAALAEYALGTHPGQGNSVIRPLPARSVTAPGPFQLSVNLPTSPRSDIIYRLEATTTPGDAASWTTVSTMTTLTQWSGGVTATTGAAEGGYVPVTLTIPGSVTGRRYFRLRFQSLAI